MAQDYEHSVFFNCPFDKEYAPLFQAGLFGIIDCGFTPRTALDVIDSSEVRIHKIYATIGECRLGIHDLSRTQLDETTDLPRFNLPLEFGIFLGAKFLGNPEQRRKACLVFDQKPYRYQTYLSDVAGQDINWHENNPRTLITCVRDWISSLSEDRLPSGSIVWEHYQTFLGELRHRCELVKQRTDELTYRDYLRHIQEFRHSIVEILQIGSERTLTNPTLDDIETVITTLSPSDDSFLILGKGASGLNYIQAYLNGDGRWSLEYQDGHIEQHFGLADSVKTGSVVRAFLSYARCEEAWKNEFNWHKIDL
jgi:hypothetical protein